MANASKKVREHLKLNQIQTLKQIREQLTDLHPAEISMALCYLKKAGFLTRELVDSESMGRKKVWKYQYHLERLPKEKQESNVINNPTEQEMKGTPNEQIENS